MDCRQSVTSLPPEIHPLLARRLGRDGIGGLVAVRELEGDADRLAAGAGAAGVGAFAPVVAGGEEVEAGEAVLGAVVLDVPEQAGVVAALRLVGVGAGREERLAIEAQLDRLRVG